MSRANSMATINNALAAPSPTTGGGMDDTAPPIPTSPNATTPAPAPPAPGSKEAKEQEKAVKEEEKAAEAQKKAADKEAEEAQARQSGQLDAITGVAKSTFETKHPIGTDFFKLQNINPVATLEALPTPGTFMFPLILLLLFFFTLIPVNGHTRVVWLWMAITGSALINPGNLGGHQPPGGATPPAGSTGTPPAQEPPASSPAPAFPTFTAVEGS